MPPKSLIFTLLATIPFHDVLGHQRYQQIQPVRTKRQVQQTQVQVEHDLSLVSKLNLLRERKREEENHIFIIKINIPKT